MSNFVAGRIAEVRAGVLSGKATWSFSKGSGTSYARRRKTSFLASELAQPRPKGQKDPGVPLSIGENGATRAGVGFLPLWPTVK